MIQRGISPRSLTQATPNSSSRYAALIRIRWLRLKLVGIALALKNEGHHDENQPQQVGAIPGTVGVDPPIHDRRGEQIDPHHQEQYQSVDVHAGTRVVSGRDGKGSSWKLEAESSKP